ncbi:serine phosphatase, partial [Arthrobacter deserti]|nr:serine phosphatase [Arthrobacter deserti]
EAQVRFYAGEPVRAPDGERVGSLCIVDTRPRQLRSREQEILHELAGWVERELALQRELDRAAQIQQMLMPRSVPDLPGYELAGRCVPTQDIGG